MTYDEIIEEVLYEASVSRGQELGDYAPIHAALDYLSIKLEERGRAFNDNRGWPKLLLLLYREARRILGFGRGIDFLEHDPWMPCYECGRDFVPHIDKEAIACYIATAKDSSRRHEFYRCRECGGSIKDIAFREESNVRQNWLPWEHEEFKYDFDLPGK